MEPADIRILEHVKHLFVLRHGVEHLIYLALALFGVAVGESLLGLRDEIVALLRLDADDRRDKRLEGRVLRTRGDRRRTGNDERRARLVDEDGVDFVNDGKVVSVLHDLLRLHRHAVVAEVVESELGVCAVGDVATVLCAALGGIHGVLDAADREAKILVEVPHPCGVAPCEIVVHRDKLYVLSGEGVQVERERRNKRLAFTRLHLGYLALMKHDAADELAVEGHHVPCKGVPADLFGGSDQMAARILHERERLRQNVVEGFSFRNTLPEFRSHARKIIVREILLLVFRLDAVDLGDNRLELLQLAGVLRSEYHLEYVHFPLPSSILSSSTTSIPDFSRDSSLILSILSSTVCQ